MMTKKKEYVLASPWTEIAKMVKASNNFKNTDLELSGDFIIYKKNTYFFVVGCYGYFI